MENVQKELNKMSNLQQTISSKLDKFDEKLNSNNENFLKDSLSTDISNNEYKQTLNNRLDLIMGKINDNIINKNYLNFYDFLLNRKKFFEENQQKEILLESQKLKKIKEEQKISNNENLKNESIQADIHRSQSLKFPTKIQLSYNNGFNQNFDNFSETFNDKNNLFLLTKKQNIFLENELINLKVKINKIRNSNQLLKNLLNKENKCKNPKILEKFIENFIEKLAINWNEICDLIIDEMIEQEVYELNELELKKIHFDELKLTTFKDVLKNAPKINNNNNQNNLMFESFYEIQRICNEIKNKEFEIQNKYNINNNNNNNNNNNKKENKTKKQNKKKNKK